MSKAIFESVTQIFQPQRPLWACEFTARHLIVVGAEPSRKKIRARVAAELPANVVNGSLSEKNLPDRAAVLESLRQAVGHAGFKGAEISVIVPDDSSRIAFITAENLPAKDAERETFFRWKLKKSVPFDTETAQVGFRVLGSHSRGTDVLVALSPRNVIQEYEELLETMGLQAGFVTPSTLAALNLYSPPMEDALFVKIAPGCITTTVFQNQRPRFYRRVSEMPLYDAVYPTVMYYQDKLQGEAFGDIVVCGYEGDRRTEISELQNKLNAPVHSLGPRSMDDVFKPALGALDMVWADSI